MRRFLWWLMQLLPEPAVQAIRARRYLRALRRSDNSTEVELTILPALVHAGDYCVDIGANFGLYTRALSTHVGPSGRVYSFEPVPSTFELLAQNMQKLQRENVLPFACAVSDKDDELTMTVPHWDFGAPNYYEAHIANGRQEDGERVRVRGCRLDSVLASAEMPISFVKCDVEGHELAVVRGALETIKRHRPAWLMEVSGDPDEPDTRAAQMVALMRENGYDVFRYDGHKVTQRQPHDHGINYLFLQPAHLKQLRDARLA